MTKTEIKDKILNKISEEYSDIKIDNITLLSGYFIFDLGEDSIIHFNVKGCKNWKFAIWILEDEKDKKKYNIEMFGQYVDYIDKFKPSASPFSYKATIESLNEIDEVASSIDINIYSFVNKIRSIKKNPLLKRWAIYSDESCIIKGFMKWAIDDFISYKIVKPFDKFVENTLSKWWLDVVVNIYKKRFKKKDNNLNVKVLDRKGWIPRWELQVIYENTDDDSKYYIYHKIEKQNGKAWLIPKFIHNNMHITHSKNEKDLRGFYYNTEEN